ncbi:MAG TPA: WD40 repeat domain-containing protein [Pseudonocardiaceae bacterium]|nr:WD40 repeat domain-containing protein [Pseudonocardiaceae bacterium]
MLAHQLIATLTGHTNNVNGLAFSPDGQTLATGSADHTMRLWTLARSGSPTGSATSPESPAGRTGPGSSRPALPAHLPLVPHREFDHRSELRVVVRG